jgi:hypothetical protein
MLPWTGRRGRGQAPSGRPSRWRRRLARGVRRAREAAARLCASARAAAERLSYRPREVATVALLAGGLLAGQAIQRWRQAYPALALRIEAEPPRLGAPAPTPTARRAPRPASRGRAFGCPDPLAHPDGGSSLESQTASPGSAAR